MKKYSFAVLAIASTVAAQADGNVTVYGQLNAGLVFQDNGVVKTTRIDNLYTPSRIGFKGEEDLGGGLKSFFQLETRVNSDDAAQTSFGDREAWVGLKNDLGRVELGRGWSPYTNLANMYEILDGALLYPMAIYSKDAIQASRQNNAIRVDTANFNGFNAGLMYSFGENKTAAAPASRTHSASMTYTRSPVFIGMGYTEQKDQGGVSGRDNKALLLAGIYTLDAFKFQLAYQNGKKERPAVGVNDQKRDTWLGEVLYTAGAATFKAGLMSGANLKQNGRTLDNTKYTRAGLGLKYGLSKRTYAIAEYVADNNHRDANGIALADTRAFTLGLMHAF